MKRKIVIFWLAIIGLIVAACGDSPATSTAVPAPTNTAPAPTATAAPAPTNTAAAAAWPRTIKDTKDGVTLAKAAVRIVSLEHVYTEDLLALGVQPVGVGDKDLFNKVVKIPLALDASVQDVGSRQAPNLEQIAALKPDLIINRAGNVATNYDELKKIAPVLVFDPYPTDPNTNQYQEMRQTFLAIAAATGRDAEGQAALDHMDQKFAQQKAALAAAGKGGQKFILSEAYTVPAGPLISLSTSNGLASQLIEQLGLSNAWQDKEFQQYGYSAISAETLPTLPADVNFIYMVQDEDNVFASDAIKPLWDNLPFVKAGHVYRLSTEVWLFGGPLSAEALADAMTQTLTGGNVTPTSAAAAWPRTIKDTKGGVTLDKPAVRVVALEWTYVEDLLALGVQPAGVSDIEGFNQWVKIPVQLDAGITDLGTRGEPNMEKLAALKPDLIITLSYNIDANYDELKKIAPVLVFDPYPTDQSMNQYQEMRQTFLAIAAATGRDSEGQAALDHMDQKFAQTAEQLNEAGKGGQQFVLAQAYTGQSAAAVRLFTDNAMATQVVAQLGLKNAWQDTEFKSDGFSEVSVEKLPELPATTNFFYVVQDNDNVFQTGAVKPLWDNLAFVKAGHAYPLGGATWLFGGPLSMELLADIVLNALAPADASPTAADSGTRAYTHVFGTTTIPTHPQRIVAADLGVFIPTLGALSALDVKPVGVTADHIPDYLSKYTAGITVLPGQPNYEAIAALKPDLIITPGVEYNRANYELLSKIAPTVAPNWYWQTVDQATGYWTAVADLVGKQAEGAKLVSDLNSRIATMRADLQPRMAGKTISVLQVQQLNMTGVYLQTGRLESALLSTLGIARPANQTYDPQKAEWYVTLSPELLNQADAWGIFAEVYADKAADIPTVKQQLESNALWQALDAVKNKRVFYVQTDEWSGTDPFLAQLILDAIERNLDAALKAEGGAASATFPVTITHGLGTAEIKAPPQRVVAISMVDVDAAYALGITPVAIGKDAYNTTGIPPWVADKYDASKTQLLDVSSAVPFESIAALKPDLILATGQYSVEQDYAKLSQIAPTIAYKTKSYADSWQDLTILIGQALGQEAQARQLVADSEAKIAAVKSAYPGIAGKTFSLSYVYAPNEIATIYLPDDYAVKFFNGLGLTVTSGLTSQSNLGSGLSGVLSFEQLGLLDADLTVVAYASDELQKSIEGNPLFQKLNAVQKGTYLALDLEIVAELRGPSALGITWALDRLRPTLAKVGAQ